MESNDLEARGMSPLKPMPGVNAPLKWTARLDEVDADGVRAGDAAGSGAVEVGS